MNEGDGDSGGDTKMMLTEAAANINANTISGVNGNYVLGTRNMTAIMALIGTTVFNKVVVTKQKCERPR